MSESDSHYTDANESVIGSDFEEGQHLNNRGDHFSDETSSYHLSTYADTNAKNKKHVRRYNPILKKTVRIEFFPSHSNSLIKNAVSGIYQGTGSRNFKSGTTDEDLFFTVILATGELGQDNSTALFFDNPEQYERHFFTKVPQQIKERWTHKRNKACIQLNLRESFSSNTNGNGAIIVK